MTEQQLKDIIRQVAPAATDMASDSDLTQYITDSIDLGEVLAIVKTEHGIDRPLGDFNGIWRFGDFYRLLTTGDGRDARP